MQNFQLSGFAKVYVCEIQKISLRADFQNSLFVKLSMLIIYRLFPQKFRFEDIWKPWFPNFFFAEYMNLTFPSIQICENLFCCVQSLKYRNFHKTESLFWNCKSFCRELFISNHLRKLMFAKSFNINHLQYIFINLGVFQGLYLKRSFRIDALRQFMYAKFSRFMIC